MAVNEFGLEEDIKILTENIEKKFKENKFLPYVDYIVFPHYKNLEPNSEIKFEFPLTLLVGKNGTGKSSVLHAIYGIPSGYSTGDYWFSTYVDPIEKGIKADEERKNKYFYGYSRQGSNGTIIKKEVLKIRQPSIKSPDYWETAAHSQGIAYGMMPDSNLDTQTRNNPVKKNVVYFDFRGELSAFDKYFHFYKSKDDKVERIFEKKRKDAKAFIRNRSKYLKNAFVTGEYTYFPNYKNKGKEYRLNEKPEILNLNANSGRESLNYINYILGKEYSEIKIIYHRIYEAWGNSIMVKTQNGIEYSEANAGSGENAVINMVRAVMKAEKNSLVILDEPEVSLHPSAQKRLKIFLLNMILKKRLQVVVSTHSTEIIKDMPPTSIKLLETTKSGSTTITNDVYFSEAFYNIKEEADNKSLILCEDVSAQSLIKTALKKLGLLDHYSVEPREGGAGALVAHHLPVLALDDYKNVFIILDGDKTPSDEKSIPYSNIPAEDLESSQKLEQYINALTKDHPNKEKMTKLFNGGNASNESNKIEYYKKLLKYAENHLFFLPDNKIPEELVLSSEEVEKIYIKFYPKEDELKNLTDKQRGDRFKKVFEDICEEEFGDKQYLNAAFQKVCNIWKNDDKATEALCSLLRKEIHNYVNT